MEWGTVQNLCGPTHCHSTSVARLKRSGHRSGEFVRLYIENPDEPTAAVAVGEDLHRRVAVRRRHGAADEGISEPRVSLHGAQVAFHRVNVPAGTSRECPVLRVRWKQHFEYLVCLPVVDRCRIVAYY